MKTLRTSLLIFSVSAAVALGQQPVATEGAPHDAMVRELSGLKSEQFDMEFLKMMVVHHESGIEMSERQVKNGSDAELKKIAEEIATNHREEIRKMTAWLEEWHSAKPDDSNVPEAAKHKATEEMERLNSLKGEDLDKAFAELMILHHQHGIAMFKLVEERSEREPLEAFAKEGIEKQQKEIKELGKFISE